MRKRNLITGIMLLGALTLALPGALQKELIVDLRNESLNNAFMMVHQTLETYYPYTVYKKIDWDAARYDHIDLFSDQMTQSQWYIAMREYLLNTVHDGHLYYGSFEGPESNASITESEIISRRIGGSFGFRLIRDAQDQYRAFDLDESLKDQGIEEGDIVTRWNGVPIKEALDQVDLTWAPPHSSSDNTEIARCFLLTRAPVGENATVVFERKQGSFELTLVAAPAPITSIYSSLYGSYKESLELGRLYRWMEDERVAYLKLPKLFPDGVTPDAGFSAILEKTEIAVAAIREKLMEWKALNPKGLVLDLRGSAGGWNLMGARICELFDDEPQFYVRAEYYDPLELEWHSDLADYTGTISTRGGRKVWDLPVIVLVDPRTVSASEGLANYLQRLPSIKIVGMFSSSGSYGNTGGVILLPRGYMISFPIGRNVDADGRVMIENDFCGCCGVTPDYRVRPDLTEWKQLLHEGKDVELSYALRLLSGEDNVVTD